MREQEQAIITPMEMERAGWVATRYANRIYWQYQGTGTRHNWGSALEQERAWRKVGSRG